MNKAREQGAGKYRSVFTTDLGCGGVVANTYGLVEVFLPFAGSTRKEVLARIGELYPLAMGETPLTKEAAARLARYFAGERVEFDFPIDRRRFTLFQCSVYDVVARIPYGAVKSYGEIAREVMRPQAARGIGRAMAGNPLPVIIPCHRVVGAAGTMTGYSGPGGVVSKQWLLRLEGIGLTERGRVG
ncbi:MAG: methylated-DNA-protein-cysteine [Geobacteraceae bacterium]|nr:MAG: methylated-DNA-protein-cysteine [Geobacteraceae bacterium]